MRTEIQKVAWRSYWPVALLALTFLLVVAIFGGYLNSRQQVANARVEKQRKAICAILANIPGHIPTEIAAARIVFARPGHPDDCRVVVHPPVKPKPSPTADSTPTPTVMVVPSSQETFIIVRPARTTPPQPSPRPSRTQPPRPTPSPSVCVAGICLPSPSLLESHDRHRGGGTDDISPSPSPTVTST